MRFCSSMPVAGALVAMTTTMACGSATVGQAPDETRRM